MRRIVSLKEGRKNALEGLYRAERLRDEAVNLFNEPHMLSSWKPMRWALVVFVLSVSALIGAAAFSIVREALS